MFRSVIQLAGVLLPAVLIACAPSPRSQPPRRRADHPRDTTRPTPSVPAARPVRHRAPPRGNQPPLIHANGVGNLHLGRPIPPPYLRPAAKPERYYELGFHADAQTYEGFRFPTAGVLVLVNQGPFHTWFEDPKRKVKGKPDPLTKVRLAVSAVKHARAGKPISWILIDRKGPRTQKGIGVGSTLAALTHAYGKLTLRATPPDFGNDQCAVSIKPLKNVWAYFKSCRDARAKGLITRMSIWQQRP